ncbi:ABC transporter permease [Saccharibacillus kuerlensis]|uniref:Transporter n=1 Tax=Saccharibacillus kuerlensis TaxID=459527 RepID=A0ABQ2L8H5_9BACL|nr:ABC transporter permease [Saccharibacillus kuerlensis]GGO04969.1 transporter [Saccharibacillus kuerlensis]
MIWNEWLKIVNKKFFVLSLIGLTGAALVLSGSYSQGAAIDITRFQMMDGMIGALGMLVVVPWAIVVSPSIWTDEYQYGTLKQLFLHSSSRSKLYAGKAAAMVLLIITGVCCVAFAALLSFLVMGGPDMSWGKPSVAVYSSAALMWQCFLYAGLASLIGVWTRSAAIGVGGGLVLYFMQLIFGGSLVSVSWTHLLFIHHDDLSLYWRDPQYAVQMPGVTGSLVVDAVYMLLFFAIGLWLFAKERSD